VALTRRLTARLDCPGRREGAAVSSLDLHDRAAQPVIDLTPRAALLHQAGELKRHEKLEAQSWVIGRGFSTSDSPRSFSSFY
jgi:hypothetical protein